VVANCDHLKNLKFSRVLPLAFTEHGAVMAANVPSRLFAKANKTKPRHLVTRPATRISIQPNRFRPDEVTAGVEYLSPLKPLFLLGFVKSHILFAPNFGVILKFLEILTLSYPIVMPQYHHNDGI
jgi:hypothetical protein